MHQPWRQYNLFLSSTFRDMDAERDMFKHYIIPMLNKKYMQFCITFDAIDLRFGINTEHLSEADSENAVLSTCFDKIDSARPFFIGFVGERYGWIPTEISINQAICKLPDFRRRFLEGIDITSVTELEILYGALGNDNDDISRSLFLFRDSSSYENMNEDDLSDYSDLYNKSISKEQRLYNSLRLKDLKNRIAEIFNNKGLEDSCVSYHLTWDRDNHTFTDESMKTFADMAFLHICNKIDQELGLPQSGCSVINSWQEMEEQIIAHQSNNHHLSYSQLDPLSLTCELENHRHIVISGERGSGKSVVITQIYDYLQQFDDIKVLVCYSGISPYTTTIINVLLCWIHQLDPEGEFTVHINPKEYKDVYETFYKLVDRCKDRGQKVICLIDDIDSILKSFNSISGWVWIKNDLKLIVTAELNSTTHKQLLQDSFHDIRLGSDSEVTRAIIMSLEYKYNIQLPESVSQKMIDEAVNPMVVSLIMTMLSNLNQYDFKKIRSKVGVSEIDSINTYIESLYDNAPKELDQLFLYLTDFVVDRLGKPFLRKVLCHIASSRSGLREIDLAKLLGNEWDELAFHVYVGLLHQFFVENPYTKHWKLKGWLHEVAIINTEHYLLSMNELLTLTLQYGDANPLKQEMLLCYCVANAHKDSARYLINSDTDDLWNEISVHYLLSENNWLKSLGKLYEQLSDEEKVQFTMRIYSVLEEYNKYNNGMYLAKLIKFIAGVSPSSVSIHNSYELAHMYRDATLHYKYTDINDVQCRICLLMAIRAYEYCYSVDPTFKDTKNMYKAMLIEQMNHAVADNKFEQVNEIYSKINSL